MLEIYLSVAVISPKSKTSFKIALFVYPCSFKLKYNSPFELEKIYSHDNLVMPKKYFKFANLLFFKSIYSLKISLFIFFINSNGSTLTPFIAIPKCKCGPLTRPVAPLSPIKSPFFTFCSGFTKILLKW